MKINKSFMLALGLAVSAVSVPSAQPVPKCLMAHAYPSLAAYCLSFPAADEALIVLGRALGAEKICTNWEAVAIDWDPYLFNGGASCSGAVVGTAIVANVIFFAGAWLTYKGLMMLKDGVYYFMKPKQTSSEDFEVFIDSQPTSFSFKTNITEN
jgi:hypothetical protein